jgi:hypothetical protein
LVEVVDVVDVVEVTGMIVVGGAIIDVDGITWIVDWTAE